MTDRLMQNAARRSDVAPRNAPIGSVGLRQIFQILRRRKMTIISVVVVVTGLSVLASSLLTPHYTASAEVILDPRPVRVANMESVLGDLPGDPATIETQVSVIESRTYAERVVDQLGLQDRPEFKPTPSRVELLLRSWLEKPLNVAWSLPEYLVSGGLAGPFSTEPAQRSAQLQRERTIQTVLDNLHAKQEGRLIFIRFTSIDPKESAQVANAVASLYIDDQLQAKAAATDNAQTWLGRRVKELRADLQLIESVIEAFRTNNNLLDLGGTSSAIQQVNDRAHQLMAVRTERAEKEARLRKLQELRAQSNTLPELAAMLSSSTIEALRQQDVILVGLLAQLEQEYGHRHPKMLTIEAERDNIRQRIGVEVDSILRTLESDLTVLGARENELANALARAEATAAEAKQAEVELRGLEREAEANRALYTNFLSRYKETDEQGDLIQPDSQLLAAASEPIEPSFPRPKLIMAGGFLGSLMVGTLLAMLVEHLDGRLRSAHQVERASGIPNLGLVPRFGRRLRHRQKLQRNLLDQPLSAYAEAVRGVYEALKCGSDAAASVVLVTSALPGEGKTTFALSLATTMAMTRRRTIVVDLDLRRPSVHRQLRRAFSMGLSEYLMGSCTLDDVLQVDDTLPDLHFLPVKRLSENPPNLLASPALAELLDALRQKYDWIVLDTPPLLGLTDTRMLAQHADQVLLAVRWEKTTDEIALNAVRLLRAVGAPLVGSVLAQVGMKRHARFRYGDAEQYHSRYAKYYTS